MVVVAVVAVLVAHAHGVPVVPHLHDLRRVVAETGPWAPLVFVMLQVLLNVPPFPRTVFTVAAGLLFGSAWGLLLTLTGTAIAAVLAFYLVRWTGGRLVARYATHRRAVWVRRRLDHHGTLAVTSLRLIPMVPFAALNYLSGLSTVRFLPYLLGTVVGSIPGTASIVILGDAVTGQVSPTLLAVSAACAVVGLAGVVIAARRPLPDEPDPA
ncbi:putative membrane protein YdjX (TVP38/TMEM64 family) [Pseudonocardia endophytica]|uniref:TVP38/TMEM64 family membrane protein n=1 Tax=Pseudonocardia endophytica TaxID=401976 RepID=A0A4R1HV08_PSEEN|nr:putative membrane protein YdjX (TVP38/TMEM64 family) [Pseudonocardia endophytica]